MNRCCFNPCCERNRFFCPMGVMGPTGPTGPTGPQGAGLPLDNLLTNNSGSQTVASNSLINLGALITSSGTGATYTSPSTITLTQGRYLITFNSLVSNTETSGLAGVTTLVNGTAVPAASEYLDSASSQDQITVQYILPVTTTSQVTFQNASTVSNDYENTTVSVVKIG